MKKSENEDEEEKRDEAIKIGVYITVPFILAASPIIGWWVGSWLDTKLDTTPYLMYAGVLLGFIAGFRELYRLLKRF